MAVACLYMVVLNFHCCSIQEILPSSCEAPQCPGVTSTVARIRWYSICFWRIYDPTICSDIAFHILRAVDEKDYLSVGWRRRREGAKPLTPIGVADRSQPRTAKMFQFGSS
jgi:hypothetical protein